MVTYSGKVRLAGTGLDEGTKNEAHICTRIGWNTEKHECVILHRLQDSNSAIYLKKSPTLLVCFTQVTCLE